METISQNALFCPRLVTKILKNRAFEKDIIRVKYHCLQLVGQITFKTNCYCKQESSTGIVSEGVKEIS